MSQFTPNRFGLLQAYLAQQRKKEDLEEKLKRWAKPPGSTEQEKCDRAVRMVKEAVANDPKLSQMDITVFEKGSYANRTNIPTDSDVDVGVRNNSLFFLKYPPGLGDADMGFVNATYTFSQFKADLARAIENHFGSQYVVVGDKAIKVRANTVRVDADVVAHAVHRRYTDGYNFEEGVALVTDAGQTINNWPQQDYENGVGKNDRTAKRYKAVVRILKNLRGEMKESGYQSAGNIASYLIACLVWNIPDGHFDEESYVKTVEDCLVFLNDQVSDLNNVSEWGEVNELKYLFRPSQGWSLDQTRRFLADALNYFRGLYR